MEDCMTRTMYFALLLAAAVLLSACAGQSAAVRSSLPAGSNLAASSPEAAPLIALPPPSQLAATQAPRRASFSEADLLKLGDNYEELMPTANVQPGEDYLDFTPSFTDNEESIDGLAFAIYRFHAEDYDRDPLLKLVWLTPPAAPGACWVGISYWSKDIWRWYRMEQGQVGFGSNAPYFNQNSEMLVVVAATGTAPCRLNNLRLGPYPPVPVFDYDPPSGEAPLNVSFDASESLAGEGVIANYSWDFNNDGIIDEDKGTDPLTEHLFANPGTYQVRLHVTNTSGVTAIGGNKIEVSGFWQHSYGRTGLDRFNDLVVSSEPGVYLVGTAEDPAASFENRILAVKLNAVGELQWARSCALVEDCYAVCAALDLEGNLLLAASEEGGDNNDTRCIVQSWSPDGQLLWSKSITHLLPIYPVSLEVSNNAAYLTGNGNSTDFFVASIDVSDGSRNWDRTIGTAEAEVAHAATLKYSAFDGIPFGMSLIGTTYLVNRPLRVDLNLDGSGADGSVLSFDDSALDSMVIEGQAISFEDYELADALYFIAGDISGAGTFDSYLLSIEGSGESTAGRRLTGLPFVRGLTRDSSNNFVLSGMVLADPPRGFLARLQSGTLDYGVVLEYSAAGQVDFSEVLPFFDGLLAAGASSDSEPAVTEELHASSELSAAWVDYPLNVVSDDTAVADVPGTVTDLDAQLVIDDGAGGSDAFVAYYPGP
jgi:hypothetical protein